MRHRLFLTATLLFAAGTWTYIVYLLFHGEWWVHLMYWGPTFAYLVFATWHANKTMDEIPRGGPPYL
jgi:hypothetical protein